MMISISSRYYTVPITKMMTNRGNQAVVLPSPVRYHETPATAAIVRAGVTIDSIATRLYGDPRQWWRIADANPNITFPTDLHYGDIVRIPSS